MSASTVGLWQEAVKLLQDGTKDLASCSDPFLCTRVEALVTKLQSLLDLPKATLKKLVQQLQVPLHVGVALSTAAQHSWKAPGTVAALCVLDTLLGTAIIAGLMKDGAAGNLAISMRQQLQKAGVLQHITAVMSALAADLRSQAAALEGQSEEELCCALDAPTLGNICEPQRQAAIMVCLRRVLLALRQLWSPPGQTASESCHTWLCDPSIRHAEAAMQLCTAALQHTSSVLQHVLPAVKQREPQHTDALLRALQDRVAAVIAFNESLVVLFSGAAEHARAPLGMQAQQLAEQQLQQLLLSPHCLPNLAALVAVKTSWFSMACSQLEVSGRQGLGGSSTGSSSRRRGSGSKRDSGRDSGSSAKQKAQQQQPGAATAAAGSGSDNGGGSNTSEPVPATPCQLQLFELLGLHPQLPALVQQQPSPSETTPSLVAGVHALSTYHCAVLDVFRTQDEAERQKQRVCWRVEQQLCLLLPAVLLPCVGKLVMLADGTIRDPSQPPGDLGELFQENVATVMLQTTQKAIHAATMLSCWLVGAPFSFRQPHPDWAGELLGCMLQLADQLLLQPQRQAGAAAADAAAAGNTQRGTSTPAAPVSSNATISTDLILRRPGCAKEVLELLARLVLDSGTARPPSSADMHDAAAVGTAPAPPVAERFGEVCTALEAGMRAFTAAKQRGHSDLEDTPGIDCCIRMLFFSGDSYQSTLKAHIGLRGPASLAHELQQFYSVLSTVQKLGRCKSGVAQELCLGQKAANMGCWAAAEAAVELLKAGTPAARLGAAAAPTVGEQAQATPAAVVHPTEADYLPSLVILGRCCLVWAEQLHQQSPELLLLLASGAAIPQLLWQQDEQQQQQQQTGVLAVHSAASVCVPWQEGVAAADAPSCGLEELAAAAFVWVDRLTSPEAQTALAAAGGGDLQGLKQQLEALAAAQVWQEGVSDASLATQVQQLQATGVMLSGIAVPHFCNNPACTNISGPTEVQLVSGRSCICAGCHVARYCGRVCQRQAWSRHKPICKTLAAAAATVPGA